MKYKFYTKIYSRLILTAFIYLFFYYFIIKALINAENYEMTILCIIGIIIGSLLLFYEYVHGLYDVATKRLIFDGKPNECLKLMLKIQKYDKVGAYVSACQIMKMLALIDLRRFDEAKQFVSELEKQDITDYEVVIIMRYCQMMAYGESGNRGKSNEAYKQLIALRDMKTRKGKAYKGALFLNWDVVNGQHKIYDGNYQEALYYLLHTRADNMNRREMMQYLLAEAIASKQVKLDEKYNEVIEKLKWTAENNEAMTKYIASIEKG